MRGAEPKGDAVTLTIERVGARGDGIGHWQGEAIYVPFTAPGDHVRVRLGKKRGEGRDAALDTVTAPGARAAPLCKHFGDCGGCALQHLDDNAYTATKLSWLEAALAHQGVAADKVHPLARLPAGTRRRARFQLAPRRIGFHARHSHRLVDIAECAVLHPALFALVAPLRLLSATLFAAGTQGTASATLTETGIDLAIELPQPPDLPRLEAMAAFVEAQDLAQLSWRCDGETVPVARRRVPRVSFAGVAVDLPSDAFLQPSLDAEAALQAAVLAFAGDARRVADLYAGIGTFTFPLAKHAKVEAVEGTAASVEALTRAAARAGLAGRVTASRRDLGANPLAGDALSSFDAVVFDPPYAGAREQAAALALSQVSRLIAVSCNPATFARDARALVAGGYRLVEVRPVDAFLWSASLELVAGFERR
jgi:23S rRNA (uracil1939-C5)-methyltransferase